MSNYEYTLFGFIKQAAPDQGTFSISRDDLLGVDKPRMNAHFKRTGADNVRSEMDRWKTIMAERGYGNMSNRDYRKWKKNPNKLYKLLATSAAAPKAAPVVAPKPATVVTPKATPVVTPKATPVVTPKATPVVTPKATPVVTPSSTPAPTATAATPVVTPKATPAPVVTPATPAPVVSNVADVPTLQDKFDRALADQNILTSKLQADYYGDLQDDELKAKYEDAQDKSNVLRTVSNLNSLQLPTESMNEVQLNELENIQNALQYSYQKFADDPNNEKNYADLKNVQQAYSEFIRPFINSKPVASSSAVPQSESDLAPTPNVEDFIDLNNPYTDQLIGSIGDQLAQDAVLTDADLWRKDLYAKSNIDNLLELIKFNFGTDAYKYALMNADRILGVGDEKFAEKFRNGGISRQEADDVERKVTNYLTDFLNDTGNYRMYDY